MKRIKTVLVAISMVLATFAIGAAAQSMLIQSELKNSTNQAIQNTNYDAMITFYIYEGEGCGCKPIMGAYINATSSEGPEFNITDEEGICVLPMVIFIDYRVTIEAENYNKVMFDFNLVDDQSFKFHMGEVNDDSSQNIPHVQQIIQTLHQFISLREGKNNVVR
jgi:hypothetical protein